MARTYDRIGDKNILNPTSFLTVIKRLPNTAFFCTQIQLPGLSISNPDYNNPFVKIPAPGDHISYENVSFTFIVQENLQNWFEILRWYQEIAFPKDFTQFRKGTVNPDGTAIGTENNIYSEVEITILDNEKVPMYSFHFMDCLPNSLSALDMSYANTEIGEMTATLTLDYSMFEVRNHNTNEVIEFLK